MRTVIETWNTAGERVFREERTYEDRHTAQLSGPAALPLDLPTNDGNPSVTHPDVLFVDQGWNGYRYWMVYTPYPDNDREDPYVVASHDGVTWEEPEGASNPIAEAADHNVGFLSDTDMVLLADGTLRVYYRPAGGSLFFKESTDGATWSSATQCSLPTDTTPSGAGTYLSPSVLQLSDGSFVLFVANNTTDPSSVARMVSDDGTTWTDYTLVTFPTLEQGGAWHLDVVLTDDGLYHLLLDSEYPHRLYYFWSEDGLTWQGDNRPAIQPTTYPVDANWGHPHYRSTFVPVPGQPRNWDIWVSGIDLSDTNYNLAVWRVYLLRGFPLERHRTTSDPEDSRRRAATDTDRIVVWDTFHRPDLTQQFVGLRRADSGHIWQQFLTGWWGVKDSEAYLVSGGSAHRGTVIDSGLSDGRVEATVKVHTNAPGLIIRAVDTDNMLVAAFGTSLLTLWKYDSGTATSIATATFHIVEGMRRRLAVSFYGDKIDVHVDGHRHIAYTLDAAEMTKYGAATQHGIRVFGPEPDTRFSSFVIRR